MENIKFSTGSNAVSSASFVLETSTLCGWKQNIFCLIVNVFQIRGTYRMLSSNSFCVLWRWIDSSGFCKFTEEGNMPNWRRTFAPVKDRTAKVIKEKWKEMSDTSRYGCDAWTDVIPTHLMLNFLFLIISIPK